MPRDIAHINLFNPWIIIAAFSIFGLMSGLVICTEEIYALLSILCVLLLFFLYYQFIGSIMAMYFFLSLTSMTQPHSFFYIQAASSLPFNPIFIVTCFTLLVLPIYIVLKNPGKLHELFHLRLSWKSYELYFIVFCSFVIVTLFFSVDQWQTLKRLLSLVLVYFLFMKVVSVFLLKNNKYIMFNFIFFVFLAMTTLQFGYLLEGNIIVPTSHVERQTIFTGYAGGVAGQALTLFNLALIQAFLPGRAVWKIGYIIVAAIALSMCFFVGIRAVTAACLISLTLWLCLGGLMNRKKPFNLMLVVSLLVFSFAFVVYQNVDLIKYFTLGKETSTDISSGRIWLWEITIKYTWDNHPFIGIGLGNSKYYVQEVLQLPLGSSHNTLVEIFLGTGLIGVTAYTLYLVWSLIEPLRVYLKSVRSERERVLLLGCFILCLAIFVISLFGQALDRPTTPSMQIFLLCVVTAEAIKTFPQDSAITLRGKG